MYDHQWIEGGSKINSGVIAVYLAWGDENYDPRSGEKTCWVHSPQRLSIAYISQHSTQIARVSALYLPSYQRFFFFLARENA